MTHMKWIYFQFSNCHAAKKEEENISWKDCWKRRKKETGKDGKRRGKPLFKFYCYLIEIYELL